MRRLPCGIRFGDFRAGQAIAEVELPEQPLALPRAQLHVEVLVQSGGEFGAVPQVAFHALSLGFAA